VRWLAALAVLACERQRPPDPAPVPVVHDAAPDVMSTCEATLRRAAGVLGHPAARLRTHEMPSIDPTTMREIRRACPNDVDDDACLASGQVIELRPGEQRHRTAIDGRAAGYDYVLVIDGRSTTGHAETQAAIGERATALAAKGHDVEVSSAQLVYDREDRFVVVTVGRPMVMTELRIVLEGPGDLDAISKLQSRALALPDVELVAMRRRDDGSGMDFELACVTR
jgi:hypothetical protein